MAYENNVNGARGAGNTSRTKHEPLEAPKGTPEGKVWTVKQAEPGKPRETVTMKAVEVLTATYGRAPTPGEIKNFIADMKTLNPGLKNENNIFPKDRIAMPEVRKGWLQRAAPAQAAAPAPAIDPKIIGEVAVSMNKLVQEIKAGGGVPTEDQVKSARGLLNTARALGDKALTSTEAGPFAELNKHVTKADVDASQKAAAEAAEKAATAAAAKMKTDFRQSEINDLNKTAEKERYKGGPIPDLTTALSVLDQASKGTVKLTGEQKIDLKAAIEKAALKHPAELRDPAVQTKMEAVLGGGPTRQILRSAEQAALRDANVEQAAADARAAAATAARVLGEATSTVGGTAAKIRANPGTELDKAELKSQLDAYKRAGGAASADVKTLEDAIKAPNPSEVTQASLEGAKTKQDVLAMVKKFQTGGMSTKHTLHAAELKNILAKADKQGALVGLPADVATQIAKLREQATATLPDKK